MWNQLDLYSLHRIEQENTLISIRRSFGRVTKFEHKASDAGGRQPPLDRTSFVS